LLSQPQGDAVAIPTGLLLSLMIWQEKTWQEKLTEEKAD